MSDIELIVKIDADVYTRLFDNGIQDNEIATDDICEMARALRLGTPLTDKVRESNLFLTFRNKTNGEVIQALFPNIDKGFSNVIDLILWWNAKYKADKGDKE